MADESITASAPTSSLAAAPVYVMAAMCLAAGLAIGYLLHAPQPVAFPTHPAVNATSLSATEDASGGRRVVPGLDEMRQPAESRAHSLVNGVRPSSAAAASGAGRMPSLEEMRRIADKQAAPLLEKLKSDPNNTAVLVQVGAIYHATHQFKEAAEYYGKAAQIDPKDVSLHNRLASSLYRSGDVDGAIAELNRALSLDSKDANSLFNLGMIRLQGKGDGKGALAAWQQLLKSNPQLSAERKATVLKLMADVQTTLGDQRADDGAPKK